MQRDTAMRIAFRKTQQMVSLVVGLYKEIAVSALSLIPGRDPQQRF